MTEPNRENIQKWVDALRSGKYAQTTGRLREGDSFCCLGVACEISGLVEWDGDYLAPEYAKNRLDIDDLLPAVVSLHLGTSGNPRDDEGVYLYRRNDVEGWTFPQIADAIERTYLS